MYRIFWKDELVAIQNGENLKRLSDTKAPFALFGGKESVSMFDFRRWLGTRVFQDSRLDRDELLRSLGLTDYDVYKIADKTKAILTGVDYYSVEWVEEEDDANRT